MNKRIEKLILNYFDNKISSAEANELITWIDKGNRNVFNDYVMLNFSVEQLKMTNENNKISSWEKIESHINQKKTVRKLAVYRRKFFRYAAAILILVFSGYYLTEKRHVSSETILIGTDKATLTLEDGSLITLNKGSNYNNNTVHSNGENLIYDKKQNKKTQEIVYNYLTIPRGGQFFIELSDNTKVWLNSESKLKYPVSFIKGTPREVELIYGEAYFEVSKSTKHNGDSFTLKNNQQTINVLGTEFNVKAYRDETEILTTLVEGAIDVSNNIENKILKPGQQSKISHTSNIFKINEVLVSDEVAWRKGMFSFTKRPLSEIMKVLSRWYDLDVKIANKEIENIKFTGVLRKQQSIYKILDAIKTTTNITYNIKNKILTIE